jgi:hypothetical protein
VPRRASIERLDADGRKVDIHALRMTFITNLHRAGILAMVRAVHRRTAAP